MLDMSEAPRKDITCQGLILKAPLPYEEGHSLNEREAGALNQTFLENLRNNYASKVVKALEEAETEKVEDLTPEQKTAIQRDFDKYCEGYEFGVSGGRQIDPVRAQAIQLAIAAVKAKLKAKGHKISEVGTEKIKEFAEAAVEANPAFMARAKEIVDARTAAADELQVDL